MSYQQERGIWVPPVNAEQTRRFGIEAVRDVELSDDYTSAQEFLIDRFGDAIEPCDSGVRVTPLRRKDTASRYIYARNHDGPGGESIISSIESALSSERVAPMDIVASPKLEVFKSGTLNYVAIGVMACQELTQERKLLTKLFDKQTMRFRWNHYIPPVKLAVINDPELLDQIGLVELPPAPVLHLGKLSVQRHRHTKQSPALRDVRGKKVEDYDDLVLISQTSPSKIAELQL